MRNKRDADTDLERDHHLMVDHVHLRVAFATSRTDGELRLPKFNIDSLYDPAVVQQWESYLGDQATNLLSKAFANIDEHCATIKNALFSGAAQDVGHVPKERHKIWLTAESWKQIDEQKGLIAGVTPIPSELSKGSA